MELKESVEAQNVPEFLEEQEAKRKAEREEKYKKSERRDALMVFAAAALAGLSVNTIDVSAEKIGAWAVDSAEATLNELEERGHLD